MIRSQSRKKILRKREYLRFKGLSSVFSFALFIVPLCANPQVPGNTPKPESIRQSLSDADALEKAGKSEDAINAYSEILKVSPENEDALEARGALYLRVKESEKAMMDFSLLILRRPKEYVYWFNRALCRRQKRNYPEALNDINQALSLNSRDERVLTTRANIYLEMDDVARATVDVDRALKDFGLTATTNVAKSVLCFKLFDTDCLLSTSEQAMRADATDGAAFNNHAYGLILKGDLDGAMRDLVQAERIAPYWSFPPNNKALIYILKKQWNEAAGQLEKAKTKSPEMAEIFVNQGLLDLGKGDLANSLAAFNNAIEVNPKLAAAYLNRARVRFALQDFDEALNDANIACKLNARSAESVSLKAKIENRLGRRDEAEADRELASRLRSTYPFAEIRINQ